MIDFPCQCGHRFSFPEEMAGAFTQCPECKRLVDIPTLGDLASLADDGTILLQQPPAAPVDDPLRIEELKEAFIRRTRDEQGLDYDLRLTREEIEEAGVTDIPLSLREEAPPDRPKYDPETGELIETIQFKPDPLPPAPVKAIPVEPIAYASRQTGQAAHTAAVQLFMPANIAVMSILFLVQMIGLLLWAVIPFLWDVGPVLALLLIVPVLVMSLAHYANVIHDIGPEQKNELPRPLRDMELLGDILSPCFQFWMSLVISFGPAVAVLIRTADPVIPLYSFRWPLTLMVAGAGVFVFPAVLLTLTTSGTLFNLRPDRVGGVIRQCGVGYLSTLGLTVITLAAHATIIFFPLILPHPLLIFPAIFACIYLSHLLCWKLGELYRHHHDRFPWVLQRHIPTPLEKRLVSTRRAAAKRAALNKRAPRSAPVDPAAPQPKRPSPIPRANS